MRDIPFCLPDHLAVPVAAAASFHIIGHHVSARDISYTVSALWLAANTDCLAEAGDRKTMYRIPDNGLRHAMGLTRREAIDKDDDRMKRLQGTTIGSPLGHFQAAYAPSRHNLDDKRTWIVHPDLVNSWKAVQGQPMVWLPLVLLRNAKSRYSVETFLHAMAAANGVLPPGAEYTRRLDDRLTIQVTREALHRFLAATQLMETFATQKVILAEVDADMPPWSDVAIEADIRTSASPRFPRGRYMSAKIHVMHPPLAELEARAENTAVWMAPRRTSVPGWETRPTRPKASRRKGPPPAPIEQVAYIPEPERPVVPPRGSTPKVPDDEDIEF